LTIDIPTVLRGVDRVHIDSFLRESICLAFEDISYDEGNPFPEPPSADITCIFTVHDSIDISIPVTSIEGGDCIRKSCTISMRKYAVFSHIIGHIDEHIADNRWESAPFFATL
jgi:hypothetical protein